MAWNSPLPANTRTNATVQANNHPDDHNQAANALAELQANLQPMRAGIDLATFADSTVSAIFTVTYDKPFPAGSTIAVVGQVNSQAGATTGMIVRLTSVDHTKFTGACYQTTGSKLTGSWGFAWIATVATEPPPPPAPDETAPLPPPPPPLPAPIYPA